MKMLHQKTTTVIIMSMLEGRA